VTDLAAPTARAPRAAEFVDVALQLIQTKGYERMSIQDVLDGAQASRGAFYHYFDSKQALLEAVIDRMTVAALASVADVLDDPKLPASAKLRGFFSGVGTWKNQRSELILGLLDVWLSDDNAVVREKLRSTMVVQLGPVFTKILAQGKDEALGHRQGAAQGRPRAARAPRVDALLEVLRRLLLEARDFEDPPGEDLALEALDRVDAELLVQELRLARTDAGEIHHLAHAARHRAAQCVEVRHRARLRGLEDLGGEVRADAGDLAAHRDGGYSLLGEVPDLLGGPAVGADPEDVRLLDLEKVGDLLEDVREVEIAHPSMIMRAKPVRHARADGT